MALCSIHLFTRISLVSVRTVREIDLLDLVAGSEQVQEDRLIDLFFGQFEVILMYR
jgi:hypothetical protein